MTLDSEDRNREVKAEALPRDPGIDLLRGLSILLVDQNARAALESADYAYVLETGRVVLNGPAAQVRNDDGVRRAYLGY